MVTSAGILLHRTRTGGETEVWIAHMGGPFWARKDDAAWSIPKGEYTAPDDPLAAALREFEEENGIPAPAVEYTLLGEFGGELEWTSSNTFEVELPRGSGRMVPFPEVDRARWFTIEAARSKLVAGQRPILDALERRTR